jgi:ABC-type polysaccharide/polyol phosphate export permease
MASVKATAESTGTPQRPRHNAVPVYDSAARRSAFTDELRAVYEYRDLLVQLIARNVKTRYKRSVLGIAWTMLNPLMTMLVMVLVFTNLFVSTVEHYPIYILSGLIVWQFFSLATAAMMSELVWGGSLLNRIYIPRTIFALSALGTGLVNVGLSLVPLAVIMLVVRAPLTPAVLLLPLPIVLTAMFALGLGLCLSTLAIQFADVVDMYQILLTAWMYLTPIFYPVAIVPAEYRWLFNLNPLYLFLSLFRAAVQEGRLPEPWMIGAATLVASVTLVLGWWVFARKADEIAYRV